MPCSLGLLADSLAQLSLGSVSRDGGGKAQRRKPILPYLYTLCLATGSASLHLGCGKDLCTGLLELGSLALPQSSCRVSCPHYYQRQLDPLEGRGAAGQGHKNCKINSKDPALC